MLGAKNQSDFTSHYHRQQTNSASNHQPSQNFLNTNENSMRLKSLTTHDLFQNQHRYDPFPSLLNRLQSCKPDFKPALPPSPKLYSKESFISQVNREKSEAPFGFNQFTEGRQDQMTRLVGNKYDPFPSLSNVKTSSKLHANQVYLDSKFRKTKLW